MIMSVVEVSRELTLRWRPLQDLGGMLQLVHVEVFVPAATGSEDELCINIIFIILFISYKQQRSCRKEVLWMDSELNKYAFFTL